MSSVSSSPLASSGRLVSSGLLRPVLSCGGALLLGLIAAPFVLRPTTETGTQSQVGEIILPSETTLIVRPAMPPGQLLRGQLQPIADFLGRAPVAGAVARQVVEPGSRVQQGDPIIEISSGRATRPAPAAEALQNQAEQSQVTISEAQNALAQKMSIAQSKLRAAQERVEKSQIQVATARDLVRRLQNGETLADSEIPAPFRVGSPDAMPVKVRPTTDRRTRRRLKRRHIAPSENIAEQQAQAASEAAQDGLNTLQNARQMLLAAQKIAVDTTQSLKSTAQSVAEVEARFDEKKASAADVQAARDAQIQAQTASAAAGKALENAKSEVARREKALSGLQTYLAKAQAQVQVQAKTESDDSKAETVDALPAETPSSPGERPTSMQPAPAISLGQAIRFAAVAIEESRRASRDAERINGEIEGYQRQVTSSRTQVESATKNLARAQQKVLDTVPRPRFTAAVAPISGVVTWVSRLAREVDAGQSIFGIASGRQTGARFEDKTGLWRGLSIGATLSALIMPESTTPISNASPTSAQTGAESQASSGDAAILSSSVPVPFSASEGTQQLISIKVSSIEKPRNEGDAAIILGSLLPGNSANASSSSGAKIAVSVPQAGQKPTLSVPISALVARGDSQFVAVLRPFATQSAKNPMENQTDAQNEDAQNAGVQNVDVQDRDAMFRLSWRRVTLGRGDGVLQEIVSGLSAGDQIVAEPQQLEEMDFGPATPSPSNLSKGSDQNSQNGLEELAVRLTPSAI